MRINTMMPLLRNDSAVLPVAFIVVLLASCTAENPVALEPGPLVEAPAAPKVLGAARAQTASGELTVMILGPPTPETVGNNCLLTIPVAYTFEGDVTGAATGTIDVLVFASCSEVAQNPPGTFADRFKARLDFEGGVFGAPSSGDIIYNGRTAPGGAVTGLMIMQGAHRGVLRVQGQVGAEGTYRGRLAG